MAADGLHFILDKTYSMKNLLTYALILPAILLASCNKLSTAPSERHVLFDDAVPLGQHVEDFFNDFCSYTEIVDPDLNGTWRLDHYGNKAYFTFESEGEDLFSYMADLYNDTVFCFYMGHEYPYDESGAAQLLLRQNCDTILWDYDDSLAVRFYLPGGYRELIIEPDGWTEAYTDSLGLARYHDK